jgi:PEP-CTERM motif
MKFVLASIAAFTTLSALVSPEYANAAAASTLTDPEVLVPGSSVSPVPNGYSFDALDSTTAVFTTIESFDFTDGPSGFLYEAAYLFPDASSAHPYSPDGLLFLYNIVLTSGDIADFTVPGYSGYAVSVKQCGLSNCIDYGANGVLMTSASRTSDGGDVSFTFGSDLSGDTNSANLQLFTNATSFIDPYGTFEDSNGNLFYIPVLTPVAAPEPSTWAMMLVGFAGLALAGYRRKGRAVSLTAAQTLGCQAVTPLLT